MICGRQVWLFLILSLSLVLAGCGDSDGGSGLDAPSSADTGRGGATFTRRITVIHDIGVAAQMVPSSVAKLEFSGLNDAGAMVYGPVAQPKSQTVELQVPSNVSEFRIAYVDGGGKTQAVYHQSIGPGATTITNPAFISAGSFVTSLAFSADRYDIDKGKNTPLSVQVVFQDGHVQDVTSGVTFSAEKPWIASIDDATLMGQSEGTTQISAQLFNRRANATVSVYELPKYGQIEVRSDSESMYVGEKLQFQAFLLAPDEFEIYVTNKVTWSLFLDTDAATISKHGLVTGVSPGMVIVNAYDETNQYPELNRFHLQILAPRNAVGERQVQLQDGRKKSLTPATR